MTILNLYIARRFVISALIVFGGVFILATLFDTIELNRRSGGRTDSNFFSLMALASLRAPSLSIKAAPFAVMLAAMWTYARLSRSSELVVARAAGVSGMRLAAPGVVVAALIGVFVTTVYNPVAAAMLERFERLETKLFTGSDNPINISGEGLWLRQGAAASPTVVHGDVTKFAGAELEMKDVLVLDYGPGGTPIRRIDAEKAILKPRSWLLERPTIRDFTTGNPADASLGVQRRFYEFDTELTPEQIVDSLAAPETISFWRLPSFIDVLTSQGFSARRHILHLHASLAVPLVFASMALLGAAFSMRHVRFGGLGIMALYAALSAFIVYFLADIAQALAGSGVIAPEPAAWGPPFAALLFAAGLLLQFEDG